MTGPLILAADPVQPLEAATKQYVDARQNTLPIGDNRIINGDMRIDQRNNGASGTLNNVYTVDRWTYRGTLPSKGTWIRGVSTGFPQFPYNLNFSSSSAYTPAAGDTFAFYQPIEADMISDFGWGSANAQSVTLSFWATSNAAGSYGGAIQNDTETRSYPFSFSIPTANIWTKIVITIPGDTAGTWAVSGNGVGLYLMFDLGSGSAHRGAAGAWVSGNIWGVTGTTQVVATNAATFYVTGVKLEIGSVATPYNRQSLAKSMADCQRYYQASGPVYCLSSYSPAGNAFYTMTFLPVTMRAAPTTIPILNVGNVVNASSPVTSAITRQSFMIGGTAAAVGPAYFAYNYTASAEL
jgi:hypothetical protein